MTHVCFVLIIHHSQKNIQPCLPHSVQVAFVLRHCGFVTPSMFPEDG